MRAILCAAEREGAPLQSRDDEQRAGAERERHHAHAERRDFVERDAHRRPREAPGEAECDQHQFRGRVGGLLLWNWHGQCLESAPEWPPHCCNAARPCGNAVAPACQLYGRSFFLAES